MVLDLYRQRAQEEVAAKAAEKPKEPTLSENLKDGIRSVLFGKMLSAEGKVGADLAKRMLNPKEGDLQEFEQRNAKFNSMMQSLNEMRESITPESIVEFGKSMPFLREQLELMTPEQIVKVFREQLPNIAVQDSARFDTIKSAFKTLKDYREDKTNRYNKLDKEVATKCANLGLDVNKFVDIMRNPNADERIKLLRAEIRSSFDITGWFASRRARKLDAGGDLKTRIESVQAELQTKMDGIGSALGLSVEENKDVRKAFMQEVIGIKDPKKPEKTFREMGASLRTKEDLVDAWKEQKNSREYLALGGDKARQEKYMEDWREGQLAAEGEASEESGGFWSRLGLAFVKMLFKNTKLET